MRRLLLPLLAVALSAPAGAAGPSTGGAFATGHYRNLFKEYLGKSEAGAGAKLPGAATTTACSPCWPCWK